MSDQQKRFVEEYMKDCNGAKAAVRAGYSRASAKQEAWKLKQDPEIAQAIADGLKRLTITSEEAIKNISDVARTRINDFMVKKKVLRSPIVKKLLSVLIVEAEKELEFEQTYHEIAGLSESELKSHAKKMRAMELDIVRLKLELKNNPKAHRYVDGEPQLVETATLDLAAIADAKELGNVSELSFGEFGPKVKMYDAMKANETILKLNGKLIDRVDNTSSDGSMTPAKGISIDPSKLTPEQLSTLLDVIRDGQTGS